jgi:hypothetical protein
MDDLARIFDSSRGKLEPAIAKARGELEECRARCQELEARIRMAEGVLALGAVGGEFRIAQPTLRAAMAYVLRDEPEGLAAPEIARRINEHGLYARPNGRPVDVGQVHNRVYHYPGEFLRGGRGIRLA